MRDKDEVLAELANARATYKDYVDAVDADLAEEKRKRLAVRQGTIMHLVAEAFASGAKIAQIQRAYDTKDYKTIRNMLDSMSAEVEVLKTEVALETQPDWTLEVVDGGIDIHAGTSRYEVIFLEGGEYLLDLQTGDNELYADGEILDSNSTGTLGQIYKALNERTAND